MSQERKDAISRGVRKYRATHKMSQAHKDHISHGTKRYYSTHYGPWKGVKRSKEFRERIRQGCLNSLGSMGPKTGPI
jgi:hypothetical protein